MHEMSIDAWKKALGTLPTAELTPQQADLKTAYEDGLKLAEDGLVEAQSRTMDDNQLRAIPANVKPPWIVALEMEDALTANNVLNSCVRGLAGFANPRLGG